MPKVEGKPAAKRAAKKVAEPTEQQQIEIDEDASDDWFSAIDDVADTVNVLLYGREGSGKTTAAARIANKFAHLPEGQGKVLVINAEGGLRKKALLKRGVDTSKIVVWPDPKKHERLSASALTKIHNRIKADLQKDPDSWGGVVIDSATEMFTALLDAAQRKRVQAVKNRGAEVDEDFVDIADYGTMSKMFKDAMRKFRDLDTNLVVTALERRTVDKDTGKPTYGPDVTPALQSDLLGYVDFVLMCKSADEDGPFRALTRANSRYRAKDRFDILPKVLVDPFVDRILGYVNEDLTPESDPEQERLTAAAATAQDRVKEKADEEDDESSDSDDE